MKTYVLRFWESEFPGIAPQVLESGEKRYRQQDLELVGKIKKMLFEEKMTIERAKLEIGVRPEKTSSPKKSESPNSLLAVKTKLKELLEDIAVIKQKRNWR